ncbi:FxsA family protein [Salmonella enterica subsp. enterica]|nr:FxsA family protein [Salmonella enterica subsp. enterica]
MLTFGDFYLYPVAHVLGVLMTLIPVILRLLSVCRWYVTGFKKLFADATKMAAGEHSAAEMIKSVSLIIAGLLLLLPGFFTDFRPSPLLLRKNIWTLKLLPHLRFSRMPGGGFSAGTGGGETF